MVALSHTIGIVGHIDRSALIDRLTETVTPDVLSIDDGQLGCEGNHRYVWERLSNEYPRSGWAVVLEDDALPVAGFDQQLEAALRVAPTPVVSLYLGRKRPKIHQRAIAACIAAQPDAHWIIATRLLHAVGVAIRTSLVDDMLSFIDSRPIDEAITQWARTRDMRVAYTWPSLVDHADEPTVVSVHADQKPRPPGRVAWRTGQRTEWTRRHVQLAIRE